MEAKDDNLFEEDASFLSITQPLAAAKDPTDDMAAKVKAIYCLISENNQLKASTLAEEDKSSQNTIITSVIT